MGSLPKDLTLTTRVGSSRDPFGTVHLGRVSLTLVFGIPPGPWGRDLGWKGGLPRPGKGPRPRKGAGRKQGSPGKGRVNLHLGPGGTVSQGGARISRHGSSRDLTGENPHIGLWKGVLFWDHLEGGQKAGKVSGHIRGARESGGHGRAPGRRGLHFPSPSWGRFLCRRISGLTRATPFFPGGAQEQGGAQNPFSGFARICFTRGATKRGPRVFPLRGILQSRAERQEALCAQRGPRGSQQYEVPPKGGV